MAALATGEKAEEDAGERVRKRREEKKSVCVWAGGGGGGGIKKKALSLRC